tara:strand:- start:6407 stop:6883 length:477 start_codon:yes stop_codon:yes gene_type:complete
MMDYSPSYNQCSVSKDFACKSLKSSQFLQDLNNNNIKYPRKDPYDAISKIIKTNSSKINIDLDKIRTYKHPSSITIDNIIIDIVNKEINRCGLGSLQCFVTFVYPKLYCKLVEEILNQYWLPATLSVFQNSFKRWYYAPGNKGYINCIKSYNILSTNK